MNKYVRTGTDISEAVRIISEGRVVAFPTGTSYGLAADALQGNALQRLRNLKNRPDEKTFTVFLRRELLDEYFVLQPDEAAFVDKHSNQPLTVLLKPRPALEHLAQDGLVGLRIIDHPLMAQLAQAVSRPLTATSANKSGQAACYDPADIARVFPGKIDDTTYDLSLGYIVDGGKLPPAQPSKIVKLEGGEVVTVRAGGADAFQLS